MHQIATKRIYDPIEKQDGFRILVDRLWPRGMKKEDAHLDSWMKQVAPSNELRKWFHQEERDFEVFTEKYKQELKSNEKELLPIKEKSKNAKVTLLYAARDRAHNHASVLRNYLETM